MATPTDTAKKFQSLESLQQTIKANPLEKLKKTMKANDRNALTAQSLVLASASIDGTLFKKDKWYTVNFIVKLKNKVPRHCTSYLVWIYLAATAGIPPSNISNKVGYIKSDTELQTLSTERFKATGGIGKVEATVFNKTYPFEDIEVLIECIKFTEVPCP